MVGETETIELVPVNSMRAARFSRRSRVLMMFGAVVLVLLVIFGQLIIFDALEPDRILDPSTWQAIASKIWEGIRDSPVDSWLLIVFTIVAPIAIWAHGSPRLVISAKEISKTGARWNRLALQRLNWTVKISEIESIILKSNALLSNAATISIVRRNGDKESLRLGQWVDPDSDWRSFLKQGTALLTSKKRMREQNLESPLVKALQHFDYAIEIPSRP